MPRRDRVRLPAIVAGALLLLVSLAAPTGAADPRFQRPPTDPIAMARAQRAALQQRIAAQQDQLTQLTTASQQLNTDLAQTTQSLSGIMVDLGTVETEVSQAQQDLAAAEAHRDDLQTQVQSFDFSLNVMAVQADELAADLDDRRRELGARLADAYRTSQTSLLEQILTSSSFADILVQQQGALTLGAHDLELAQSIQTDQAALDEQRLELQHMRYDTDQLRQQVAAGADQISMDRDALIASQEQLALLQQQTADLQAQQQAKLATILSNRQQTAAILAEQLKENQQLGSRIDTLLQKEKQSGRLPSVFNGTLRWPLIGTISQEFGCTGFPLEPAYGTCAHFHQGIDIVGPLGAPIVAAGDGIVLMAGWDTSVPRKDAAFAVVIAHSNSLVTIYGHLQPRLPPGITVGAGVHAGQLIGWEGNTGNSTGPHLHWGVRLDGKPVNPRFFL